MGLWERIRPRWNRPPEAATALVSRGERIVAWGTTDDGSLVVATVLGLWLPESPGRLGWHEIHKAGWDSGVLSVTPSEEIAPGVVADGPVIQVRLTAPGDLPPEIRTRVTRSVAYSHHHQLPGGGVWVVGRRVPGVDGLTWVARYDPGTDHTDNAVQARVADLVATAAASAAPPVG